MPYVNLDRVTVDFGSGPILDEIGYTIEPGDKIGLVGPNGEGKTTMLSVIAGVLKPHSGDVHVQRGIRIGYLRQEHALEGGLSLFDAVYRSHPEVYSIERRLEELSLGGLKECDFEEYRRLENRLSQLGGYNFQSRVEAVLFGLGFSKGQFSTEVEKLSGGERNRAAIACILLEAPDILLLDEPTNHIDYDGLQWLAEYLQNSCKTYVVVSHDRYFLDVIARETVEIRDGEVSKFAGNYSFYEKERKRLDEELIAKYEAQRAEIARTEDFIRKNIAGQKTKQAQSRRTMLAKLERIAPPPKAEEIRVRFKTAARGGEDVFRTEGLSVSFGERKLFEGFNFLARRGDRIGVVGPNGCGKTTLLSAIAGRLEPSAGRVRIGSGIKKGYYSQDFQEIDESNSAFEEIHDFDRTMTEEAVRSSLALFSLYDEDIFRPLRTFSGGEVARVALLKLLLGGANLLLLDEPTNHLDIKSRITLEKALSHFEGTVIFVSHDRYFLRNVAQKIIAFERGQITLFDGGFEYYLERRAALNKQECRPEAKDRPKTADEPARSSRKNLFRLEKERAQAEDAIARLEADLTKISQLLSEEHVAGDWGRMSALLAEFEASSKRLEGLLAEWERLEEQLAEGEGC